MPEIPEKLTFRLGSLRAALADACDKSGRTPSEEIRRRLAKSLRVEVPDLKIGRPIKSNP